MKHFAILAIAVVAGLGTSYFLARRFKDSCIP